MTPPNMGGEYNPLTGETEPPHYDPSAPHEPLQRDFTSPINHGSPGTSSYILSIFLSWLYNWLSMLISCKICHLVSSSWLIANFLDMFLKIDFYFLAFFNNYYLQSFIYYININYHLKALRIFIKRKTILRSSIIKYGLAKKILNTTKKYSD